MSDEAETRTVCRWTPERFAYRHEFIDVSPSPPTTIFGGRQPVKSATGALWWVHRGKRMLGEDPFEIDRWTDDGGAGEV